jgi:large subunit ribosomal protein L25
MRKRHALEATKRTVLGKEVSKLRRVGQTPGVVYGPVVETPAPVSVDTKTFEKMYHDFGANLLIDLQVDGSSYTVYMRHVDIDRVQRRPRHVEFYAPNLTISMTTDVPLNLVGEPAIEPAVITHGQDRIHVQGLPDAIPAVIEIDLANLKEYGDAIHVSDLRVPEGVTILNDPTDMVIRLDAPAIVAAEEDAAEEEAEEAAEAAVEDAEAETES